MAQLLRLALQSFSYAGYLLEVPVTAYFRVVAEASDISSAMISADEYLFWRVI